MNKRLIIVLLAACFLQGCNPVKKAVRVMNEHPEAAALYCADAFPVHDSLIVRDSISYDTLWSKGDSVYIALPGQYYTIKQACPPARIIIKTVRHDSLIIRRDIARETVLRDDVQACYQMFNKKQAELNKTIEELDSMRKARSKWRLWFFIACGAIGMYTVLKIRKLIPI